MQIAERYVAAQRSFVDLVTPLTGEQWATPVPCNPGWTVRDVLSHVAGVTADIAEGNVEGAATDPWTAVQVERWSNTPTGELIAQWHEQIGAVAEAVQAVGEHRPPLDCHTHEHDVRHALELPGNRDSELVRWTAGLLDLPVGRPVSIVYDDGSRQQLVGAGDPVRITGLSRFELVRSRLGRRSRRQVESFEWSDSPTPAELDEWFVFGPSIVDIIE